MFHSFVFCLLIALSKFTLSFQILNSYGHKFSTHFRASALSEPPKNVGFGLGLTGLLSLLSSRLISSGLDIVSVSQSRDDLISVMACSAVLLDCLSKQDVKVKERSFIALVGYALNNIEIVSTLPLHLQKSLKWITTTLLKFKSVTSIHVVINNTVVAHYGVIAYNSKLGVRVDIQDTPILMQALGAKNQTYLPDMQILPGKVEFSSYLPINCQSVLIVPLRKQSGAAIIIGMNKAKSLSVQDVIKVITSVFLMESLKA